MVFYQSQVPMKDRFGTHKVKRDGTLRKEVEVPPTTAIHRSVEHIADWIRYACDDAEMTWYLRLALKERLSVIPAVDGLSMYHLYLKFFVSFGEMLTDIERKGFKVDLALLKKIEDRSLEESDSLINQFRQWACTFSSDARYMNVDSDKQKQALFFAPVCNRKTKDELPKTVEFDIDNSDGVIEPGAKKAKRKRKICLEGIGLPVPDWTPNGWPSTSTTSLQALCGSPPSFENGLALEKIGKHGCEALNNLLEANSISTLRSSFIVPLQALADTNGRIHASLNINTETGRLSCRRPNLQNQPALEKDRYKIRSAFICEEGHQLIVADYGQLELRLLAHLSNCRSMIEAFEAGGDFHSRTACSMYEEIQDAISRGEVRESP
uniref:DNA-directed DNA polymerase family A palm domain-containing protein n=1 Tax=Compsopogon caeruleus TaxID=31354 RepID=A0A7S1T6Z1_9RHOD|mmetsp:Transcript_11467/g.23287  ORF Transcript_11467/g.23287 Transcript_11467/m.23287 type:complete len:380 (+) Transcript_11467:1574-2713(+)